jgi:hypothetical protein
MCRAISAALAVASAGAADGGGRLVTMRLSDPAALRLAPDVYGEWSIGRRGVVTYRTPGFGYDKSIEGRGMWSAAPGEPAQVLMPEQFDWFGLSWKAVWATDADEQGARFLFATRGSSYSTHRVLLLRRTADGELAPVVASEKYGVLASDGVYSGAKVTSLGPGVAFMQARPVGGEYGAYAVDGTIATPVFRGVRTIPGYREFGGGDAVMAPQGGFFVVGSARTFFPPYPSVALYGVWHFDATHQVLVLGPGTEIPGPGGGTVALMDVDPVYFHPDVGYLILGWYADGAAPDAPLRSGVWRGWPGSLVYVADGDAPLPGLEQVWRRGFGYPSAFGGGGDVVFAPRAPEYSVPLERDWSLCASGPAGFRLLAREGSLAPSGDGIVLEHENITSFAVNSRGLVAMTLWTGGAAGPGGRRWTMQLIASDASGRARHLAREGQETVLDTPYGRERFTIDRIERWEPCASGPDRTCVLNDAGELVVLMRLARDGALYDALVTLDADRFGPCAEDLTGDGRVDGADVGAMLASWGTAVAGADDADLDGNLTVSAADLSLLLAAWGACAGSDFASVAPVRE